MQGRRAYLVQLSQKTANPTRKKDIISNIKTLNAKINVLHRRKKPKKITNRR